MSGLLRVYLDPNDIGPDGYPYAWHKPSPFEAAIKDSVRAKSGDRCVRCGHPYKKGMGEWSACDEHCTHGGEVADTLRYNEDGMTWEARWRILTVHHLNGIKHDCRWWNLAALCQRCHLTIQAKVHMLRPYHREHSDWFKPYVAGFYAWHFLGEELTREQTEARLDELLALEHRQLALSPVQAGEATERRTN